MIRPLELFIGLRYTRAKRRNHFISFISLISMLGIAVGVTALITVLSVMNGFEKEMRERILGMTSHATISAYGGPLNDWQGVAVRAREHGRIQEVAPYIQAEVMATAGDVVSGTILRGILPGEERKVAEVADKMVAGKLEDLKSGGFGIVLGQELAYMLGVQLGDKVTVVTPNAATTPAGILPRLKRFTVVGIFEVGMYEYDRGLVMVHMEDAARLLRMEGVTGVRLKLDDLFQAPYVVRELAQSLSGRYFISDWTRQHANFFKALKTEKRVMFIIILLIVAVAAFNIVSTLVIMVSDKQPDIAVLRTLGMSPGSVMSVFMVQGTLIGVVGTLLGLLGGIGLALNVETIVPAVERLFGIQFLPGDIYYISKLPSDLHLDDVLKVSITAFILSVLATIYPALRASRTHPAEALRYE